MSTDALNISLFFQCMTGIFFALTVISAAYGIAKNLNAVDVTVEVNEPKKNPGKAWLVFASVCVVITLVFGGLGFAATAELAAPAPPVTAAPQVSPEPAPMTVTVVPPTKVTSATLPPTKTAIPATTTPTPIITGIKACPKLQIPDFPAKYKDTMKEYIVLSEGEVKNAAMITVDVAFGENCLWSIVTINYNVDHKAKVTKLGPVIEFGSNKIRYALVNKDGSGNPWPELIRDACRLANLLANNIWFQAQFQGPTALTGHDTVQYGDGAGGYTTAPYTCGQDLVK